jgi:hypothetical protein
VIRFEHDHRTARAAFTHLAEPAHPLLGALLESAGPCEALAASRSGTLPPLCPTAWTSSGSQSPADPLAMAGEAQSSSARNRPARQPPHASLVTTANSAAVSAPPGPPPNHGPNRA